MHTRRASTLVALLAAALVASCGGGGGSGTSPSTGIAGIQGTGVAIGAIASFGSIFVNGVEYRTNSATITINGRSGTESELRVGQVVTVRGSVDANGTTGLANSVSYDDEVKGLVTAVNATAGTLVIVGQAVITDGLTSYGNVTGLAALVAGTDYVEVSGYRDGAGAIRATRIEKIAAPADTEVSGPLAALDTNAKTFRVGGITVNYASATTLTNFSSPANGQRVEARGALANGVLRATYVEGKGSGSPLANGDKAEVEGIVTRYASNADFDVNGIRVTTSSTTQFPSGTTIALGARVEVEGTADANGAIAAARVDVRDAGEARVTAVVGSVDAASSRFTLFGVTATVTSFTRFEDKSPANARPFNLSQLRTGDYVEVRGAEAASGGIAASYLERQNPRPAVEIRGLAKNVDATQQRLSVVGVAVRLAAGAQCRDADDQPLACTALFSRLAAGSRVTARESTGTASTPAGGLVADRLSLAN